jgi:N-acetylneuraminic acid mutarotase
MSKKRLLTVAVTLVLLVSTLAVLQGRLVSSASGGTTENTWTEKAPMPTARCGLGAAVVNGKIYTIGGYRASIGFLNVNEEYDPVTDTWRIKSPMPTPRKNFGIAVFKNKIYVIGGQTGEGLTSANEVYDPATDTWEVKAPMPTARIGLSANTVNGKIYAIGGLLPHSGDYGPYETVGTNEVYDPLNDSWSTANSLPHAVQNFPSAVLNSKIFVISGSAYITPLNQMSLNIKFYYSNQVYNPVNDAWGSMADIVFDASGAGAAVISDEIYVVGGMWSGKTSGPSEIHYAVNFVHVFDSSENAWREAAQMSIPRHDLAVATLNNAIYAIGGSTLAGANGATGKNEQYIPLSATPSPQISSSPNPTLTPAPLSTPTPSPASTQSHETGFLGTNLPIKYGYAIAAVLVIIIVAGLSLFYLKKLRNR